MQAIITKCLHPTNFRGLRFKASCRRGSIVVSAEHSEAEDNHIHAAQALINKFIAEDANQENPRYSTPADKNPWSRNRCCGQLPSGDYAHVFCD